MVIRESDLDGERGQGIMAIDDTHDEADERLEALVCEYIDRFNEGDSVAEDGIAADHPELPRETVAAAFARIQTFVSAAKASEELPREFGNYTLRRRIGAGGMGVVYEAWQESKKRSVAIKRLRGGRADMRAVVRFAREAQLAARLKHENIVRVYGMAVEDDTPYYVMELVDGASLDAGTADPFGLRLGRSREDHERVALAFAGAADGVHHAHSNGIIHRDIKPSNLILDRDGRLRVLDFGLAFVAGDENLTVTHEVVGTAAFMSPEQIRSPERVDHRTDVYSLGASLYAVLAGRPPFDGHGRDEVLLAVLQKRPAPLRRVDPTIPVELDKIVAYCLHKEPGDRYSSAAELAADLRLFAGGGIVDPLSPPFSVLLLRTVRRAWKRWALLVFLLLALALAGGYAYERYGASSTLHEATEQLETVSSLVPMTDENDSEVVGWRLRSDAAGARREIA